MSIIESRHAIGKVWELVFTPALFYFAKNILINPPKYKTVYCIIDM
jgi:hypothetical protein